MMALTLWPEWAWAVCQLGKDVENRGWRPWGRLGKKSWLAIHAGAFIGGRPGKQVKREGVCSVLDMAQRGGWSQHLTGQFGRFGSELRHPELGQVELDWDTLAASAIIAVVKVPRASRASASPWAVPGEWHWELEDLHVLAEPVDCPGRLGLWAPGDAISEAVLAQLEQGQR